MELKQLEAFVEVAESGSFSKAAKRLFLTQPTVSAHILALEKELDIRLFVRNTKEVCLTEEGQRLYFYARQMADLQCKIKEEFGHRKTEEKQCIAIAASTVPAQYLLPELLAKFNEKYPGEQLRIREMDSAQVVEQVLSANEKSVADYRSGKEKAFGFLVGQVMRQLRGQAAPAVVRQVLLEQLAEQ